MPRAECFALGMKIVLKIIVDFSLARGIFHVSKQRPSARQPKDSKGTRPRLIITLSLAQTLCMILGYGVPLNSHTLAEKGGESTFFSPPPAFFIPAGLARSLLRRQATR